MSETEGYFERNRAGTPESRGLYDPIHEHDSCGVGFVARIDGKPGHTVVKNGVRVLVNLEHRGAVGSDRSTGDGAGLLLQVPDGFFRQSKMDFDLPVRGKYAVGMLFTPKPRALAQACRNAFEKISSEEGLPVVGWRQVPTDSSCLGKLALSTEPDVWQLFLSKPESLDPDAFERKLFVVRRRVEKEVASMPDDTSPFYVSSLSSRVIVYKGLLTGTQLPLYYPDLRDHGFESAFALVHQRYSTNTLPGWNLAQPFRYLGHNGEINTLRGNINRMKSREALMQSPLFGKDIEKIKPVIVEGGSDSAVFDNVLELLVMAGRSLPHAMMMMVPESFDSHIHMSEDKRAFYEFHSALMEPWDGPAALVFSDGRYIGATLDRNGLRPARYTITKDGWVVLASETGVLEIPGENILSRGRLQPGKMFLLDMEQNRIVPDNEIKAKISRQSPYRRWIQSNRMEMRGLFTPSDLPTIESETLHRLQLAFGYTDEDVRMLLNPMASRGQEAIGSMGNDAPLAVLSENPQLLFSYFKQLFAQVTNPPIDPLREELVMSLESFVGRENNLLVESPDQYKGLKLHHPILTIGDMARIREARHPEFAVRELDTVFQAKGETSGLRLAVDTLFLQAEQAIREGATLLILSDKRTDAERAPIPALLAAAGLHHHLIRKGLRNSAGIIVETGEVREIIHFALLVAYGADAICPYLAFHTIRQMAEADLLEKPSSPEEAMDAYVTAVKKGLLKTTSRMGISTVHSFFGSQIFEAVGIGREVIDKYFTGTASRIGGIGLAEIAHETVLRHGAGFPGRGRPSRLLKAGGAYRIRVDGERHFWNPDTIYRLQQAVRTNNRESYEAYAALMDDLTRSAGMLRGFLEFKKRKPVPIEEVEPVESIIKRFVSSAMSFGSISKEAHETIAVAMNGLGASSNSGEGGEDPDREQPLPGGLSRKSRIRQVASGRFGVTNQYLIQADELQIKIAQGAKPGEGGQLPGHKVSDDIARVRHTTPGVTLISPPPHHDIYSIEDLAQLIYDLKTVNPGARISVKLVSEVGVGTIASGVAKARADMVLISGQDGGTGASPLTAIKHAGLPWELGLAETQQSLIGNALRERIRVQVDGQLKTGRDLAVAALLGAEEFGFGTAVLISIGCVMMRKCHLNTCPVGVATQDPLLRSRFAGKAEHVERFCKFVAQDLRGHMAGLGFRTVDDMVGRTDLLEFKPNPAHWKAATLDLRALLEAGKADPSLPRRCIRPQNPIKTSELDTAWMEKAKQAIENNKPVVIDAEIRNVHRTVGARLSAEIVKRYGAKGLWDDTIRIQLKGSAGQSLGAFLAPGITLRVEGDANDYVGKGMSGGRIILVPPEKASFQAHENVICGNVALYGATAGEVYISGTAGERFAVRNSGAVAVVEGVGDHGCEYMTGGAVVVIGPTGKNFAAGMSGGIAYVFDETELFDTRCNLDMVDLESVWAMEDKKRLRFLLENHVRFTGSQRARTILYNWDALLPLFVKVMPMDYRKVLERMRLQEDVSRETVSASEEVFHG
jgi:glutamate synthase (NADPH/NADH) large chain/glutamate synthase (ferredoxin)